MNVKTLLIFTAGVAIGSAASYFLTKESMHIKTQQEINDMRDYYAQVYGGKKKEPKQPVNDDEIVLAANGESGYNITKSDNVNDVMSDYHTESDLIKEEKDKEHKNIIASYAKPYIIDDEEWQTSSKYCKLHYRWYYEHQVMLNYDEDTNDMNVVDDPYGHVGLDNLQELEESADGYINVRNDNRGEDYEVVLYSGEPDIDVNTWEPILPPDDEDDE